MWRARVRCMPGWLLEEWKQEGVGAGEVGGEEKKAPGTRSRGQDDQLADFPFSEVILYKFTDNYADQNRCAGSRSISATLTHQYCMK